MIKDTRSEYKFLLFSPTSEKRSPAQLWLEVQLQRFSLVGKKEGKKKERGKNIKKLSPKC